MASMVPYNRYGHGLRRSFPFEDFFDDFFTSPLVSASSDAAFQMNVEDAGEAYVVTAHLAGVNRDEIDVELNEGRLSISVDKKETEEEIRYEGNGQETCGYRFPGYGQDRGSNCPV